MLSSERGRERAPAPALAGGMGCCGKGTFADFLRALLDKRAQGKVLETSEPEKHVWGDFNPLMQHAGYVDRHSAAILAKFDIKLHSARIEGNCATVVVQAKA